MGRAEKICEGCRVLVLTVNFLDEDRAEDTIYPAIISGRGENVLVDCGCPGFLPRMEEAALFVGVSLGEVTDILITHHDYDHYGALRELREKYPNVRVMASEMDAPYIEGLKKSMRLVQADAIFGSLPPEERDAALKFQRSLESIRPVKVDVRLKDGDTLPACGARIIATPGHMPGHISVLVEECETLITGDALVAINGRLRVANPHYAMDAHEAYATAKMLESLDVKRFVCYHGGVVDI
ncbi:MAG: MBL fold metallo-hydrolase [Synergistaceae bacterium]|jgi:glyoxylase-like metal-dependent hydrolase (beta-lactamase superfamily II)|nr:MBL fold metallo-hydrolase [Synergistaceae bacterium]